MYSHFILILLLNAAVKFLDQVNRFSIIDEVRHLYMKELYSNDLIYPLSFRSILFKRTSGQLHLVNV